MHLTIDIAMYNLYNILKENAPVRDEQKYPGPKGKPGTNKYSPYPGNLRNNGIYPGYKGADRGQIVLSGTDGKVGYLPYTETKSNKPGWQQKSINQFVSRLCSTYGGKRI